MWRASLRRSSPKPLAWSTTVASSHLIRQWLVQACSATADFSICCLRQASLCSLRRVSSRRLVSPMYDLPHEQGIWYTTPDWRPTGSGSFTLVKIGTERLARPESHPDVKRSADASDVLADAGDVRDADCGLGLSGLLQPVECVCGRRRIE